MLFPKRSVKMIDGSEKRNRRLAFELIRMFVNRAVIAFTRVKVQHFCKVEVYKVVRPQHVDRAWTSISGFQTQVPQYIYVFIYLSVLARTSTNDKLGPFTSGRFGDKENTFGFEFRRQKDFTENNEAIWTINIKIKSQNLYNGTFVRATCFIRRVCFYRLCVGSTFQHGFYEANPMITKPVPPGLNFSWVNHTKFSEGFARYVIFLEQLSPRTSMAIVLIKF